MHGILWERMSCQISIGHHSYEARAGIEPAHSCFADSRVSSSPTRQHIHDFLSHGFSIIPTVVLKLEDEATVYYLLQT